MPYSVPPGGSVTLIFRSPYSKPPGGSVTLEFAPPAGQTISTPSIGDTSAFGVPVMLWTQFIATNGIPAGDFGSNTEVDYRRLKPEGFGGEVFGAVALKWTQFIEPLGIEADAPSSQFAVSNLSGQYVIPSAVEVVLRFGPLVSTASASAFPVEFHYPPGTIRPLAWSSARFGQTQLIGPSLVIPSGISSFVSGSASISPPIAARNVAPGGIAANPLTGPNSLREVPSPVIDFRTKHVTPSGIAVPSGQLPVHYVAFYYQFIDTAGLGSGPETYGTALAAYKIRSVFPSFIASNVFGATAVLRTITVHPSGFGGETFSTTNLVEDYSNRVQTHSGSADPAAYGIQYVRNQRDFLYVDTSAWIGSQVNFPVPYNLRQVLTVQQFQGTDADTAKYGQLTITNRNRQLTTFGHQDSRFSYYAADIANAARAITPDGLDATLFGASLVAYRIRYVSPVGFDSFYTYGTIVYNAARVIGTSGVAPFGAGQPLVFNRNRTVYQYFPQAGETFGTPFVAFRIRNVNPSVFNDVPSGFPEVRLNPYPIATQGIDSYRTGGTDVIHHRNEVFPYAVNVHPTPTIGSAYVVNRNRNVYPFGYEYTDFGTSFAENFIREVQPPTVSLGVLGQVDIAYKTKTVRPAAFSSHTVSVFAQVRNVIPDPPGQQLIYAPSINPGAVGYGALNYQTLFPESIAANSTGSHKVRSTNLAPVWTFDDYVGTPTMVATQYLYPRYIPSDAEPGYGESDLFKAKPAVSPHTIYAPSADQATQQAKNNNGASAEVIDAELWFVPPFHFGKHVISNRNRSVETYWLPQTVAIGTPAITLKTRKIAPVGSRFVRFGPASLNGAQEIQMSSIGSTNSFGNAAIPNLYVSPYVYAVGSELSEIGRPDIDNFNRTVRPSGEPQTEFGTAELGPPKRLECVGFVATMWGSSLVAYRNRFVFPVGHYSFVSSNSLPGFNDRMRVRNATPSAPYPVYPP